MSFTIDIKDVYHRLLRNLLGIEHVHANPLKRLENAVILIAERLVPSDIVLLDRYKLAGLILEKGSKTSHVAIIAQSMGIPVVINIPDIVSFAKPQRKLILDGFSGKVIVNPTKSDIKSYEAKENRHAKCKPYSNRRHYVKKCKTKDGVEIQLEASANTLAQIKTAVNAGACGIGLLRSEIYYMTLQRMPSIDEEYAFYKEITNSAPELPITIRLLDLGADKTVDYVPVPHEANPQLGMRGIRLLLKNENLFEKHVISILRICKIAKVKILLPFISIVDDLFAAVEKIEFIAKDQNVSRDRYKIGIMVEIPSVAIFIEPYLKLADFIAIGTNDLLQYLFAADRDNPELEGYRFFMHPALLVLIKNVADRANACKKPVSVCGEIASDPYAACLLVGLGIRSFSMAPEAIAQVRSKLETVNCFDMEKLANNLMSFSKEKEIRDYLKIHCDFIL